MHGDSKIDNFMFKKVSWSYHVDGPDDVYNAVIVDWQVIFLDVQQTNPKIVLMHCTVPILILFPFRVYVTITCQVI